MLDVEFPRLADTLVEGTITAWYKAPGDIVKKGEALFAVETEKVNTDVEAPAGGIMGEILASVGTLVQVGEIVARIGESERATPTGQHTAMNVAPPSAPPPVDGLGPMRRRIAERMLEARATIAQGSCTRIVDLSTIDRAQRSWTAFFVKALALGAGIKHVGIAVEIPGGLVVPVVHDADTRSVAEIGVVIADLATRAKAGALTATDVNGGEFTVTNVGATGTLVAFPLVNAGEPGILAPGAIVDGRCWLTLCYDRAHYDEFAADALLRRIEESLLCA